MNLAVRIAFTFGLLLTNALDARARADEKGANSRTGDRTLSARVQEALQVAVTQRNAATDVERALAARLPNGAVNPNSPDADFLVDQLNSGCLSFGLADAVLASSDVTRLFVVGRNAVTTKGKRLIDGGIDTRELCRGLFSRAAAEADIARARRLAVAALMLAAQSPITTSPGVLQNRSDAAQKKPFDLARLSEEQQRCIEAAVQDYAALTKDYVEQIRPLSESLDQLIRAEKQLSGTKELELFLSTLPNVWNACGGQYQKHWKVANMAWRLACLARSRGDKASLDRLQTALIPLRQVSSADAVLTRWLNEVMTIDGPAPKSSGLRFINSPDDLKRQL